MVIPFNELFVEKRISTDCMILLDINVNGMERPSFGGGSGEGFSERGGDRPAGGSAGRGGGRSGGGNRETIWVSKADCLKRLHSNRSSLWQAIFNTFA